MGKFYKEHGTVEKCDSDKIRVLTLQNPIYVFNTSIPVKSKQDIPDMGLTFGSHYTQNNKCVFIIQG